MTRAEVERLPLDRVQRIWHAYNEIIEAIEIVFGGPSNIGANSEYWSAVGRRNICRRVYNERLTEGESHG